MINNHVKAIIKDLDYYCSYSCIANCFDRCIFSIKNQFSPEKQASNIAQAIKKDDEKALAKEVTTQNDQKLSKQEDAHI